MALHDTRPLTTLLPGFLSKIITSKELILVSKGIEKGNNDLPGAPIENYIPLSAMLNANPLPLSLPTDLALNPH